MLITISRQYLAARPWPIGSPKASAGRSSTTASSKIAEKSGLSKEDVQSLEENVPTFLERLRSPRRCRSWISRVDAGRRRGAGCGQARAHDEGAHRGAGPRDRTYVGRRAPPLARGATCSTSACRRGSSDRDRHAEQGLGEAEAAAVVDERDPRGRGTTKIRAGLERLRHYHLVLNTELLGTDGAADLVARAMRSAGKPLAEVRASSSSPGAAPAGFADRSSRTASASISVASPLTITIFAPASWRWTMEAIG